MSSNIVQNRRPGIGLDRGPLDEQSRKLAEEELRETPEIKEVAIKELRKLLKEDESLHYDDSDEFLTMILRPVKFYPESAHALLRRIAQFRQLNEKILKDVSPIAEKDSFLNTKVLNVLVHRDQHRRRILTMNIGKAWNPDVLDIDKLFRVLYLIHFGALMEPITQIHGAIIIMDFSGLSLKQARAFTPSFANRLITFIQEAMPLRLKAIHIVFQPYIFNIVWMLFKQFLNKKLSKRIYHHGSKMEALLEHIDPDCLPEIYGGTQGVTEYSSADWFPVLAEHEEKIKEWQSYGFTKKI